MAVYSVFEPPSRKESAVEHAERFAFVRDAFSWSALVFGPLWILRHRLWLSFVLYAVLMGTLLFALTFARVPAAATMAVLALIALLLGFEGNSLRRWTLRRRGWRDLGVVVGDDLQSAERRFFDGWIAGDTPRMMPTSSRAGVPHMPQGRGPDVIGLFPEPGAHR